jgi:hypothetical protein
MQWGFMGWFRRCQDQQKQSFGGIKDGKEMESISRLCMGRASKTIALQLKSKG